MSLYKRGDVWWYKFWFNGQLIRESSKGNSKTAAKDGERARRRELEQAFNPHPTTRAHAALLARRRSMVGKQGRFGRKRSGALRAMRYSSKG